MKEVFSHTTYIYRFIPEEVFFCAGCGLALIHGDRISKLITSSGIEYYHFDKCLKGVDIVGQQ